ncbi:MAG: hypothetical protein WC451_01635 [Patescibacteria group bacterium]
MIQPNKIAKLAANTKFINRDKTICASDFWAWAYSDLLQNTTRGVLAEYIVSFLLGTVDEVRNPWDAYDLKLKNGKTIEIKTTAKLQAWAQKELSKPNIVLSPTRFWDPKTGKMEEKATFNADYYIFCYFTAEDHKTANPLDLSQWQFYVFTKEQLITILNNRKSISLKNLEKQGIKPVGALELRKTVENIS